MIEYDLVYLATPYTKYPGGIERAFVDACALTARLLQTGVRVYSPIAHTHPIALHGNLDPLDLSIWLPFDAAIMAKSDALVVAMMTGWRESTGVAHEIEVFSACGKPIYDLDPETLIAFKRKR
jgi:nucleoside 2-deoxyribosyltransferase